MSTVTAEFQVNGAVTRARCLHCGTPLLSVSMAKDGFCCAGCRCVYRLVQEEGLEGYYRIKDVVTAPADPPVLQPRDCGWLQKLQDAAETEKNTVAEATLQIQGISCAACVWLIERTFERQPGARCVIVNAQYGSMLVRWTSGEFSLPGFARKLQEFGYLVGEAGGADELESRSLGRKIGLCAAFSMNVMLFSLPTYFGMEPSYEWAGLFGLLNVVFATLSLLVGGSYFFSRAIASLREGSIHIDLPISLGIAGAFVGSLYGWASGDEHFVYFDFVAAFILLMLVGRWAQVAAVERNRRRLLRSQARPSSIRLAEGGEIAPEHVSAGLCVALQPGQTLPVEARLLEDGGVFSLASINGEAEPRSFGAGARVPAGAVNVCTRALKLETVQSWQDSLLRRLLAPTERKSERHRILDLIVKGYLFGIIVIAVVAGAGWWLTTHDIRQTGAVVTAVLVVSCPCAVALAFPLADEIATVALRKRGVFVRQDDLWTKLGRVRSLVFDKTGTLTFEAPVLQNPEALDALTASDRAALGTLVRDNPHPVCQSLFQELHGTRSLPQIAAGEVRESVGNGLEMGEWSLGRPGWKSLFAEGGEPSDACTVFCRDGRVLARFRFADVPRPDARVELGELRRSGFALYILSGDRTEKVQRLADELGVPGAGALGGMSPVGKAEWLESNVGNRALMLGDGANDSLAFDRALCRGTPVIHRGVLENKADFYYLGQGLSGIRALFEVNAVRQRTQRAILVFSVAYNLFAVGLAVAGLMNPLIAAILMPVNSLLTLAIVTIGMRKALRIDRVCNR
jgi:P-type Cu2+ transporter